MVICAVYGCSAKPKTGSGIGFFRIPAILKNQCSRTLELSTRRRALWLKRINRKNLRDQDVKSHTVVCSKHFLRGKPSQLFDETNPDWAPSQHLGYGDGRISSRYDRSTARRQVIIDRCSLQQAKSQPTNLGVDTDAQQGDPAILETSENTINSDDYSAVETFLNVPQDCSIEGAGKYVQTISTGLNVEEENVERERLKSEVLSLKKRVSALKSEVLSYEAEIVSLRQQLKDSVDREKGLREECVILSNDNNARLQEVIDLRQSISRITLNENSMVEKHGKVNFYTGLPTFTLLMHVFNLVSEKVNVSSRCHLSKFQEFLLTLMRLRLGLLEEDLGYRFGVHQTTVNRIFHRWIVPMSYALEKLIAWPDRETLFKNMPLCFQQNFGKSVAVIIDCFEVFIERPSSHLPRAGTWSDYKHHNTVKLLIGITPQGTVSFISKAWVPRSSDKLITENCGLLDLLAPGDVVLADRGFNIVDSLAFVGAKVIIPAFTNKPQLSFNDVETTRKVANVRIHVERVIGLVRRKYQILKSTLPIDMLTTKYKDDTAPIDHITRVCCALTNLCPPVVPID